MGMIMSLTAITPEQYEDVVADPGLLSRIGGLSDPHEYLSCGLDKAWDGLTFLLEMADLRVSLQYYAREVVNEEGTTCAWSAEEVRDAAEELRATPFGRLAGHFDPQKMTQWNIYPSRIWERDGDEALDYLREYYQDLMRFFDAAARSGAAVVQTLG